MVAVSLPRRPLNLQNENKQPAHSMSPAIDPTTIVEIFHARKAWSAASALPPVSRGLGMVGAGGVVVITTGTLPATG